MSADYRHLCVEHLTEELRASEGLHVEALIDAQAYRQVGQQAIHLLHERDREMERQRRTIARLREECRQMREKIVVAELARDPEAA